jgi:hypothetical protein
VRGEQQIDGNATAHAGEPRRVRSACIRSAHLHGSGAVKSVFWIEEVELQPPQARHGARERSRGVADGRAGGQNGCNDDGGDGGGGGGGGEGEGGAVPSNLTAMRGIHHGSRRSGSVVEAVGRAQFES